MQMSANRVVDECRRHHLLANTNDIPNLLANLQVVLTVDLGNPGVGLGNRRIVPLVGLANLQVLANHQAVVGPVPERVVLVPCPRNGIYKSIV